MAAVASEARASWLGCDLATRLTAHLQRAGREPFDLPTLNCAFWVADWIQIVRGVDPVAAWRGRVKTKRGVLRMLAHRGYANELEAGTDLLRAVGLPEIAPCQVVVGDVAIIEKVGKHFWAIYDGRRWAAKIGQGLWAGRPVRVLKAWAING